MVLSCQLCNNSNEWLLTSRYCSKCQRLKWLISIYGDDVYNTLETVLVRTDEQQNNKITRTINPKIERKLPNRINDKKEKKEDLKKPQAYKNVN